MLNAFHYPLTHTSWYEYLILLDFVILAIYMNYKGPHYVNFFINLLYVY